MNHILLTGATGVIGSALLAELLTQKALEVTILIRAKNQEHLVQRASELLDKLEVPSNEIGRRVHLAMGDITEPNIGLKEEQYEAIQSRVTHIVHSAGKVKLNQSLEEARSNSLFTAKQMIAFAQGAPNLEKADILSTIGVAGCLEGRVPEERLTQQRKFHNTYEQSKAEAEELYWQALADGLPISIHRPSMVVGDSQTGEVLQHQVFYYLCDFLSGRNTLGVLPNMGSQMLDIVPVDYVVRCIVASMFSQQAIGRVFHLCNGPSEVLQIVSLRSTVRHIYLGVGRSCPKIISVSPSIYRVIAWILARLGPRSIRKAARNLPFFLAYLGKSQIFESASTEQWLAPFGIRLPNPDEYLKPVVEHYLNFSKGHA